jgi:hypothetical protein
MIKSELIQKLNNIKDDVDVILMVDTEVCADDNYSSWRGRVRDIELGINVEYSDRIFTDIDDLHEHLLEEIIEHDTGIIEAAVDNEIDRRILQLNPQPAIIISVGV